MTALLLLCAFVQDDEKFYRAVEYRLSACEAVRLSFLYAAPREEGSGMASIRPADGANEVLCMHVFEFEREGVKSRGTHEDRHAGAVREFAPAVLALGVKGVLTPVPKHEEFAAYRHPYLEAKLSDFKVGAPVDGVRILSFTAVNGRDTWRVKLWVETKTLTPVKREAVLDGKADVVVEEYAWIVKGAPALKEGGWDERADERARAIVSKFVFPSVDGKGPHAAILADPEAWVAAIRWLDANVMRVSDRVLTIEFKKLPEGDLGGTDGSTVSFDLDQIAAMLKAVGEARAERDKLLKAGKKAGPEPLAPTLERVVRHEMMHTLQGDAKAPEWFVEGYASWAQGEDCFIAAFAERAKGVKDVDGDPAERADLYGRGHLFMKWVEAEAGRDGMKALPQLVYIERVPVTEALEKVLKRSWATIKGEEKRASTKALADFRKRK